MSLVGRQELGACWRNISGWRTLLDEGKVVGLSQFNMAVPREFVGISQRVQGNSANNSGVNQIGEARWQVARLLAILRHYVFECRHVFIHLQSSQVGCGI